MFLIVVVVFFSMRLSYRESFRLYNGCDESDGRLNPKRLGFFVYILKYFVNLFNSSFILPNKRFFIT